MSRAEAITLHLATALVAGTGLVYAWMLYLLEPADPFAVVHHPWQPAVQHLHVLVAPLLVFAAGLVWRSHVWTGWRSGARERLRSGVGQALTLAPMIASGYLLQTAVDPDWRRVWVGMHLVSAGLWLAGYLAHQLAPRAAANHRPPPPPR
jgi:GNAT superfamily N-acetyltransferase